MGPLGAIALILGLGVGTQWLAWRLRAPSILVLLIVGFVAGPVTGWIDPDRLFGSFLQPLIGLSVAIIIFEGGLGLRIADVQGHGKAVARLVTLGVAVTAAIAAVVAHFALGLPWDLAALLGAILTVSGPTVVLPLLRLVRPRKEVEAVLRWEGILIDPVGALLAVLVFEAIRAGSSAIGASTFVLGLVATLGIGAGLGVIAAWVLVQVESRYWVPDHLLGAVGLGAVVGLFVTAEAVQPETGLIAVTVMGVALANQERASIHHLVDFKENLSQVLLGSLFIILAARVRFQDLRDLESGVVWLLLALVFVARPLAVLLSTRGTPLSWRDRAFLAWLAPRGIVAAAVSAFFALKLEAAGRPEAAAFVPVTFVVIVGTVALYGLTARPLARWLGVAGATPEGVLFVGANRVTRTLARILEEEGFPVVLADTDPDGVLAARTDGRRAVLADPLKEGFTDGLDLDGIGRLWAMTPDEHINHLACVRFAHDLGRAKVYAVDNNPEASSDRIQGRTLFREGLTYRRLRDRLNDSWTVRRTPITQRFDAAAHRDEHGSEAEPLWLITETRGLEVFTEDHRPAIAPGKTLVALVPPADEEE